MKYKAIIFDLDNTLYDRDKAQNEVIGLLCQHFPHILKGFKRERLNEAFIESDRLATVDFEAGVSYETVRLKRTIYFLQLLGIKQDYADTVTEIYVREYPRLYLPVNGAIPLVKELSMRLPVALITNGFPDVQYTKLETIGLKVVFTHIVLSEEIGIRKPDPRIFHHTANLLQIQPFECLYVGDSYRNDVVGAKSAGMQACWFNQESETPENVDFQADLVISRFEELANILKE